MDRAINGNHLLKDGLRVICKGKLVEIKTMEGKEPTPKESGVKHDPVKILGKGGNSGEKNANDWGNQDSQYQDGAELQQTKVNWNPSDSQVKDSGRWDTGNNQGGSGNFGPSDSQRKDSGGWKSDGNYPSQGNFDPNDAQVKDSNRWNDGANQQPAGPFVPNDAQEKSPGPWTGNNNQQNPGNWNPADGQVKDNEIWNKEKTNQGDGSRWSPGEGQMKINEGWNQEVNTDAPRGQWDQNQGSNIPGLTEGAPVEGKWKPDEASGPAVGGQWPAVQDDISKPPIDQVPAIDINQGNNQPGEVGIPDSDYGTGGNRDMGDTGMLPEGFPPRVPQGNYKGGDTGRYPGDDPSQWRLEDSIPGTPGVDYPNYSTIPQTSFDCKQHENPGYYGDVEAQCQVFHICQADGRHNSFLCPLGTIFNQQYFVCVWWFNYDCEDTTMYYNLNADLYKGGHGGQGNFKGTPVGAEGPTGGSGVATPQSINTGVISDVGRTDYGRGGQVDSIIPPGVGVNNVGQAGVVEPIPPPVVGPAIQPETYGPNEVARPDTFRPPIDQPVNVPNVESPKPYNNDGIKPDVGIEAGGRDIGYGQGGQNNGYGQGNTAQDSGKRNWGDGNQSGKRNWGVKGGPVDGNQGGRWNPDGNVMRGDWGNENSKKGGYVKGRKARSWGSGDTYDSELDKRWGSDNSEIALDGQEGNWMKLEEIPPPLNSNTNARAELYENEAQNQNWNARAAEEQKEFVNEPPVGGQRNEWKAKENILEPFEGDGSWSSNENRNNLQEIGNKPEAPSRKWRTIEDSTRTALLQEARTPRNNWWRDTLEKNVNKSQEGWKEDPNDSIQAINNVQDAKDTPHTYGNWRSLNNNNYYDHDKDYSSERNSEQQNWTN
ncbi:U-scoloptoxin(01)-Cw1a like protein [Argiope bruennichi]|uniref:U-scoloptoxin(01)-Cw1a like protein n=1 Tax=Argiope bruennichi TaxID=94029 RepID=A0A8T0ENN7_ARGBR|nr:U-scoloptoxin(01)-Cw1a like protein [Argiope bruennichi]